MDKPLGHPDPAEEVRMCLKQMLCLVIAACAAHTSLAAAAPVSKLFVDAVAESSWFNLDLTPSLGTAGLRQALNIARDDTMVVECSPIRLVFLGARPGQ